MAKFSYDGRRDDGMPVKGVMEAASTDAVATQLLQNGVIPLDIHVFEDKPDVLWEIRNRLGLEKPTVDDLILFCRQCYALNKAGVPIIRGFKLLSESCRNRVFSNVIENIADDLESGRELSSAMARYPDVFSGLFINMIKVGETSGRLDEAFLQLYDYLERDKETVKQIKAAVRYPSFVLTALVIAVFIVMTFVIPKFSQFYEKNGLTLPLPTRIIMGVSDFTVSYWPFLVFMAFAFCFSFKRYIATEQGRLWWDRKKIEFFIVGDIILRATLGRFSRTLAMSLNAGVPILQAITVTSRAIGNEYISSKIIEMRDGVERGENLTRTMTKSDVFTALVLQMVAVGEETGRLDEMLEEVAGFYEREVDYDVKHLNSVIEPLLTVGMAALVLLLMLGIFLPMWDLVKMVQK